MGANIPGQHAAASEPRQKACVWWTAPLGAGRVEPIVPGHLPLCRDGPLDDGGTGAAPRQRRDSSRQLACKSVASEMADAVVRELALALGATNLSSSRVARPFSFGR
jgi:hypothetical protein